MLGLLQRFYRRHIEQYQPPPAEPLPDPEETPEHRAAKENALAARERAEKILRTLSEQKPVRPAN